MNKAVFLDRDGTLIEEKNYLAKSSDIEILPNTYEGLKLLKDKGYLLIIVTNQSGVARGYFDIKNVEEINNYLKQEFIKKGINIDEIYFCPHLKNGKVPKYSIECNCRKPKIGLIEKATIKYNIDLSKSYVIGDKQCDILLAHNANCKAILIENNNYQINTNNYVVKKDILDAAKYIIKQEN